MSWPTAEPLKIRRMKTQGFGLVAVLTLVALTDENCGGKKRSEIRMTPANPAPKATSYPPEALAKGRTMFQSGCSACHRMDAQGGPGLGSDLTASQFVNHKTDDGLLAFIKQGRAPNDPLNTTGMAMPPKGGNPALKDDDLRAVIAFLRSVHS